MLEAVAARIARSLAARGVRAPFDLIGHSLGGAVALTLAARRPGLVRRLVLVAPAGLQGRPALPAGVLGAGAGAAFAARRALAPLTEWAWGRRLLLAFAVADAARLSPAQAQAMVRASAGAGRISPAMSAIAGAQLWPLLTASPVPLGLLWGAADRAVPRAIAREIVAARPDAELEIIPGAAHVPMVERPHAFTVALERLWPRLRKDPTSRARASRTLR